ncbi:MAG: nucleotide exchange factor GrpE [Alphaproteobacteria bacterium]
MTDRPEDNKDQPEGKGPAKGEDDRPLRDKLAERGRKDAEPQPEPEEMGGLPGLDEIDFDAMDEEEAEMLKAVIAHIQGLEQENAELRRENTKLRAGSEKSAEVTKLEDQVKRLMADQQNVRARLQRQAKADAERDTRKFATDMLSIADNLDRAVEALENGKVEQAMLDGVKTTQRQMESVLRNWGIEKIEADGAEFNAEEHEAMMVTPTDDQDKHNTVAQVLEAGYRMNGTLLRAARVAVAQHPNPKSDGKKTPPKKADRRRPVAGL